MMVNFINTFYRFRVSAKIFPLINKFYAVEKLTFLFFAYHEFQTTVEYNPSRFIGQLKVRCLEIGFLNSIYRPILA